MFRARVTEDFQRMGVRIQSVNQTQGGSALRNFAGGSDFFAPYDSNVASPAGDEWSLFLADDEARAIWEELCRYFGGHPPTVTDRADLVAERARVDKLTDAVIQIATRRDTTS
jgi:hypothetical protein